MIAFDHPLWPRLRPYAKIVSGRDNVDLLQLPDDLRAQALDLVAHCVCCAALIHPFRVRTQSKRARIAGRPEERRLFYAATCPASVSPGCARSRQARDHKHVVRTRMGLVRESQGAVVVLDASGEVLLRLAGGREKVEVELPAGARTVVWRP